MKIKYLVNLPLFNGPKPFIPGDVKRFEKMLINGRAIFAKTLGVPIIMANRVGTLETELPGNLPYLKSSFPGLSSIVDSDGTVKGELGDEEEILVADVCLRQNAKHESEPKRYGKMWGIANLYPRCLCNQGITLRSTGPPDAGFTLADNAYVIRRKR